MFLSTRRVAIVGGLATALPWTSRCASAAGSQQFGAVQGYVARVEGIGGGADVLTIKPATADAIYPPSLIGLWQCERKVTWVEGDEGQARGAWFDLGGSGEFREPETYKTRFVPAPSGTITDNGVGTVTDRGFEIASRVEAGVLEGSLKFDVEQPDTLFYERRSGKGPGPTELAVVQRTIELPSDKGWGSDELVRVSSAAGGLFGSEALVRCCRIKRRYRRAYNAAGERVVEALEIVKTYRVLDGVAGVEMPTSTTKSTLRLTRPPSNG